MGINNYGVGMGLEVGCVACRVDPYLQKRWFSSFFQQYYSVIPFWNQFKYRCRRDKNCERAKKTNWDPLLPFLKYNSDEPWSFCEFCLPTKSLCVRWRERGHDQSQQITEYRHTAGHTDGGQSMSASLQHPPQHPLIWCILLAGESAGGLMNTPDILRYNELLRYKLV